MASSSLFSEMAMKWVEMCQTGRRWLSPTKESMPREGWATSFSFPSYLGFKESASAGVLRNDGKGKLLLFVTTLARTKAPATLLT